ncbi:MAG: ATP-dependent DNA helicase RecG [Candidatus Omnitrophica bacterium]|nr:ATP-dependent DNA helicase RecG [Candidatus Omnitrophota bacterium]
MIKHLLTTSIQYIKGVGPRRAKACAKVGIRNLEDVLYYFPRRYEDRCAFASIAQLEEGSVATVQARVVSAIERRSFRRRRFSFIEVVVQDASGKITCVWFNQPYLKEYFKPNVTLVLFGKVQRYGSRLQMNAPEFEIITDDEEGPGDPSLHSGRIVPMYSLPEGITQRFMRQLVKQIIDEYLPGVHDALPYDLRQRNNLLNLAMSIKQIHFPESAQLQRQAYERLSFEEFFLFQLPLALRKARKRECAGIRHMVEGEFVQRFMGNLTFTLTPGQQEAIAEIKADMAKPQPMQRLLQGDVGSGKTVVATIATLYAMQGGYQVALMVPTEILAKQHYENISGQLSAVSSQRKLKIELLTSNLEKKRKKTVFEKIQHGEVDLMIGTHALLEEAVQFKKLGLVVIDEQHKFGVGQRALLQQKGINPDVLIMTATPIPRTLAITLYGDLDISIIRDLPPGRIPVQTKYFSDKEKQQCYTLLKAQLAQGHQAFVVYPVIEESYALDIAGAIKMYQEFKSGLLKTFRLGLIHGRLTQDEQNAVMHAFKQGALDALVTTTVLEVGIDVPRATCMVIEHAERFGLSQLHQLRGRVGRGSLESYCFLIADAKTEEAQARIQAMVKHSDGFRIAEEDLKIRGPGEFFGRRQHGLSELKIGNPLTQLQLLKRAREEAIALITQDSLLVDKQHALLREKLLQRFPEYERLVVVG